MKKLNLKTLMVASMFASSMIAMNGCTYNYDDENRRIMEEGSTYDVFYARIVSVTPVTIREEKYDGNTASAMGVLGGAAVGSIVGYNTHHHHYSGYHHGHHYHGHSGSTGGALVGGLIGAGVGLLIGEAVKQANNVKGMRLNLVTSNNENFAVDVPSDNRFASGGYVQVNVSRSGHTQVVPISREGYDLALSSGKGSSLDTWADEHEEYLNSNPKVRRHNTDVIEYDDY